MKLVEASYSHLATQLAATAKQISFLEAERERIKTTYSNVDPEDGSFVGFIGEKLVNELTNAIDSVRVCLEPVTDLLTRKLAEPVEEQLELGTWKETLEPAS
jgi:hypothetical protein